MQVSVLGFQKVPFCESQSLARLLHFPPYLLGSSLVKIFQLPKGSVGGRCSGLWNVCASLPDSQASRFNTTQTLSGLL